MKNWIKQRENELIEKTGYTEMVSMGAGYSEWEIMCDEDYIPVDDMTASMSYRLYNILCDPNY